jgi:hypothetical protein
MILERRYKSVGGWIVAGLFGIWILYAWQSKLDTLVEEIVKIRVILEQQEKSPD